MEFPIVYNRTLIFDGSHCLHRALSVENNWVMQTASGMRTGGIFGVLRTILKELKTYNYYPIVVFDGGLSKRRLELYPNYKHTIDKQLLEESSHELTEEELLQQDYKREYATQREILKQILPLFNIPVICYDGWEGDDLIYILSKISKDSIIVSDDKDLIQLVREDNTGRCRNRRAMREEFWDLNKLKEESIDVNTYITNKAIVGDSSDNIPSACYGVGSKTASDLYTLYQTVLQNNIKFPESEEELTEVCKKYNLSKRKAFINFDEGQFLTNLSLTDLKLVDSELQDVNIIEDIINHINKIVKDSKDVNIQIQNIINMLNELEIKTLNYNELYNIVKDTQDVIYNINTNLTEIRVATDGLLF